MTSNQGIVRDAICYYRPFSKVSALVSDSLTDGISERHKIDVKMDELVFTPVEKSSLLGYKGVIIELKNGLIDSDLLSFCKLLIKSKTSVYFYWPFEQSIEYVDAEKLQSMARHKIALKLFIPVRRLRRYLVNFWLRLLEIYQRVVPKIIRNVVMLSLELSYRLLSNTFSKRARSIKLKWKKCTALSLVREGGTLSIVTGEPNVHFQAITTSIRIPRGMVPILRIRGELQTGIVGIGIVGRGRTNGLGLRVYNEGQINDDILFNCEENKKVSVVIESQTTHTATKLNLDKIDIEFRDRETFRALLGQIDYKGCNVDLSNEGGQVQLRKDATTLLHLDKLISKADAIMPARSTSFPAVDSPYDGAGVYLRMDFWAPISSGGSYGHTCYVAKNLAATTESFIVFMANRYSLMDEMGLNQNEIEPFTKEGLERNIIRATSFYYDRLFPRLESIRPCYIYERICLGNYASARLSQDLGIPLIVEYNGSEISMSRSFDGKGYEYEDIYLKAEELSFKQATIISVVSEAIRDDLLARGVDPEKILVNPNGADLDAYCPGTEYEKASIRASLGFSESDVVIGFSGTFGGWHGVDLLAEAIPLIIDQSPNAKFLMIGDGANKYLIDEVVETHSLESKVVCAGRVPQQEGAKLLKACDILVSPHNAHMIDSRFFGSPTKLFEYMAVGAGIVASDLEQIGEVLSPALVPEDFHSLNESPDTPIVDHPLLDNKRAILCEPGNLDEFVESVLLLVRNPRLSRVLGASARKAVRDYYSWEQHVKRLWAFLLKFETDEVSEGLVNNGRAQLDILETGDLLKDAAQDQWDNDACGSHYVEVAEPNTLEWYQEVEQYRYEEYAPWMKKIMEFSQHRGETVLEIGAGIGTDLAQYACSGAIVTDLDLSGGHLRLAENNFKLRGLQGTFVHHDAENLPFEKDSFDLVYSNGVIHHIPDTGRVVEEIFRVLKPGGKAIVMVYAENSWHYWHELFLNIGVRENRLDTYSMGEIMSQTVEISETGAKPLVKVYTKKRITKLFMSFDGVEVIKRQMVKEEVPFFLRWIPTQFWGSIVGWNLIVKATKPSNG